MRRILCTLFCTLSLLSCTIAQASDPGSISETAAALEVSRTAADTPKAIPTQVIRSQARVVQKAQNARDAARLAQCQKSVAATTYRVAVYDLERVNIPEGMARVVTTALLAEVRKLEGASVIGMEEIREMLNFEAQRQAMGCDADESCMA